MYRKDLNELSPVRLLDSSIHGGLGRGNIGVAVGRHGVGKTAFLVGVALDDLMRGRKVLHVALDQPVEKVREYYDSIFAELARTMNLENVAGEHLLMERHRNIYTYLGSTFSIERLRDAVAFLKVHAHFAPVAVMIDGYEFASSSPSELESLKSLAREMDAEIWMTAVTHRESERNDRDIPEPVAHVEGAVSVIVSLAHDGKAVHVKLLKDHDNPDVSDLSIALNPTTMLLVKEKK